MITLRFFYKKDGELYLDPGQLAMAARAKAEDVRCVVHGKAPGAWVSAFSALNKAADHLRAGCLARLFKSVAMFSVMLLAGAIVWWVPFRPLGHDFGSLATVPLAVAGLALAQVVSAVVMYRRVQRARRWFQDKDLHAGPDRPLPLAQMAPRKTPSTRRWPALLCTLLAIIFIVGMFPYAVPIPGYYAAVTSTGRASDAAWLPLSLGERWELTPRRVNDYALGLLYYDAETEQVLVLEITYQVTNRQRWSQGTIREQFSAWTSWLSQNLTTNLLAELPPELDDDEVLHWLHVQVQAGVEAYAGDIAGMLQEMCSERLECASRVRVGVKLIPLAEYRSYLRRE